MEQLLTFLKDNIAYTAMILIISVGILFLLCRDWNTIRRKMKKAKPVYALNFLEQWDLYRQCDRPGCYIILIYKRRPRQRLVYKLKKYTDVYVGQSINMYKRVYNHLTGHGNGDVYADMKYKKHVYIKFIPCATECLNTYERWLIEEFNATDSYNRTKGGAKLTCR